MFIIFFRDSRSQYFGLGTTTYLTILVPLLFCLTQMDSIFFILKFSLRFIFSSSQKTIILKEKCYSHLTFGWETPFWWFFPSTIERSFYSFILTFSPSLKSWNFYIIRALVDCSNIYFYWKDRCLFVFSLIFNFLKQQFSTGLQWHTDVP